MKQIDGLVTKDKIYRLISGLRTRFKISEEAAHEMAERVAQIPTIEAKPVKHGRWIDNGMVYTCSECNSSVPKNIFVVGCNFEGCPYCFARMDGDDE